MSSGDRFRESGLMMRRIIILMVLSAIGLVMFSTTDHSVAQDGSGERLSVGDFAPIGPENVLYLEAISEFDPELEEPILSVAFGPENASFMATTEHSVMFWSVEGALNGEAPMMRLEVEDGEWLETVFSEDQGLVAIGTGSGIEVWDTVNVEQIGAFEGERERWQVMAFSGDGEVFVYQLGENLRYWDTVERVELASRLLTVPVRSVAFSREGEYAALVLDNDTTQVQFLDFPDIDRVATLEHETQGYYALSKSVFSPHGRWLFVYGYAPYIEVWDTDTWTLEQQLQVFEAEWWLDYVDFSPDGSLMIAGDSDYSFNRWAIDEAVGEIQLLPALEDEGAVPFISFTPDSQLLAIGWSINTGYSVDGVYVIDPVSGRAYLSRAENPPFDAYVEIDVDVDFSSDGRLLVYPTDESSKIAFVGIPYNLLTSDPIVPSFEIPELPPTERERITPETVSRLEMTELDAGEPFSDVDHMDIFSVRNVTISPDSNEMSWTYHLRPSEPGTGDEQVFLFRWNFVDAPSYGPLLPDCGCFMRAIRFNSEGRLVAYVTFSNTEETSDTVETAIIDVETQEILETLAVDPAGIWQVSPNGEIVAIAKRDNETQPYTLYYVTLWNLETNQQFAIETPMRNLGTFRPDSEVYFVEGQAWDTSTGELVFEYAVDFHYADPVAILSTGLVDYGWANHFILGDGRIISVGGTVATSPNQSFLARAFPPLVLGAREPQRLELVESASFERLANLELGGGEILFTPDGTRLVNAGQDDVIRVWSVAE